MRSALGGSCRNAAVTRQSETQRAGGPVHSSAVGWVIPRESAIEAGFRLSPMNLLWIRHYQKFFRWISSPCRFSAADAKPCFLVFSPLMEVQPQVPPQPDPGTSLEQSAVLSSPVSS